MKRKPGKRIYEEIVFLQGDEANEALDLLDKDENEALAYLQAFDMGEGRDSMDVPWGPADSVSYFANGYVISYNTGLNYIALTHVRVEKA